ncbi:FK506-binding protein 5 isoform X2 [Harpegnathos saltator]|uniref:FK506-binding protein 5 isoform X2 n=2 Tax=Harpegnathos saltator TaxID=610380 RepID=UPI000DBEE506|nr:FK506-binding protein 5 isoform X2 [Harpegnathos saltator]XP_025163364.1 FK506-binding protein 5 isoform X2 [Harpegnathos saltator]
MAASALEEKINKIKQQNEEIRRRYEEVEEDKKNAAKLNALVQMVPSTDWPERKEPPEFSNPPRASNKPPKPVKEHHEYPQQYHVASGEGRKAHVFSQGQRPPPDPKYNFLADSEREEGNTENIKDNPPNRGQKHSRGMFRRKVGGKDGMQRDYRTNRGAHRDEYQPEYEAWRAERNRIDEDRISRQRTAEGNWRREWDNDKAHIVNEVTRSEAKLGDYVKKDHKDYTQDHRRYHANGNDYAHHNRGGNRSYRGNSKHFHSNYENRSNNAYHQDGYAKNPLSPGSESRTVIATDKGIKVTLNQGNMAKGPVTSVKVNSPSIAGTGRVGPRQRSRVTYSSHSDVEITSSETDSFSRPKSFEDKSKGIYHDNLQKSPNARKTQPLQRKKDLGNKSPYFHKKEVGREDTNENVQKQHEMGLRPSRAPEESKNSLESKSKSEKLEEINADSSQNEHANVKQSDETAFEPDAQTKELNNSDDQKNESSTQMDVSETHVEVENESTLTNLEITLASQDETEIQVSAIDSTENESNETEIVQAVAFESKAAETDIATSAAKDNDKNDTKFSFIADIPCDINNDIEEIVGENKQSSSTKQTEEIVEENKEQKLPTKQIEEIVEENKEQNLPTKQTEEIVEKSEEEKFPTKQIEEIVEENKEQNLPTKQIEEIVEENKEQNLPTKQTEEIVEKSEEEKFPTKQIEEIVEENKEQNLPTKQIEEIVEENKEQNLPTKQTEEIVEKSEEEKFPTKQIEEIVEENKEQNSLTKQTEGIVKKNKEQNLLTKQIKEIMEGNKEQNSLTMQTEGIVEEKSKEQNSPTKQTEETVEGNKKQNLRTEQIEKVVSDNSGSKQNEDVNEQENDAKRDTKEFSDKKEADDVISSTPTDACSILVEEDKPEDDNTALKKEEILINDGIVATSETINTNDKQDTATICINETQERIVVNNDEEKKNDPTNDNVDKVDETDKVVVDKIESSEGDLQAEKEKATPNEMVETEK